MNIPISFQCEAMTLYGFYTPPPPPNENGGNSKGRKKREEPQNGCGNDQQRTHIAENLLQVNVFFKTLNIQSITEEPKYEVHSSIAGHPWIIYNL